MRNNHEEWRPIAGYEGLYEVSSLGRVWSVPREAISGGRPRKIAGRFLKQSLGGNGYLTVSLHCGNGQKTYAVHRLMGISFLGVDDETLVRHLNDIRTDNSLDNLAPGTGSDNQYDRVRNGHHHNANKVSCKRGHPFSPENTYVHSSGGRRECRTCRRLRAAKGGC